MNGEGDVRCGGDECDAICGRVTRGGEGGKSTRRREYVSTPVINLWRGGHVEKVAQISGGICPVAGGVCGIIGAQKAKGGRICRDDMTSGSHDWGVCRTCGTGGGVISSLFLLGPPCDAPAAIDTRFPHRFYCRFSRCFIPCCFTYKVGESGAAHCLCH